MCSTVEDFGLCVSMPSTAPVMWGEVESDKTLEKWKARAIERAGQSARPVADDELGAIWKSADRFAWTDRSRVF